MTPTPLHRCVRLVFVTGNAGKFKEASHELQGLATLEQDTDGYTEIQADTLREVAAAGLDEVGRRIDPPFFLEDAGLFIDPLQGFPGVYSAYAYKTLGCEGILRLMFEHHDTEARRAQFQAVVAYRDAHGQDHFFTGKADGSIAADMVGDEGFGFDPIFIPLGKKETFAQMGLDAKGKVSHRGKAMAKFRAHLEKDPIPDGETPADTLPAAPAPTPATPPPAPKAASKAASKADQKAKTKGPTKGNTSKPRPVPKEPAPRATPDDEDADDDGPGKSSRGIVTVLDDEDDL